jgi:hypothetical protein
VNLFSFVLVFEGDGVGGLIEVFDTGEGDDGSFGVSTDVADGKFGGH